MQEQRIVGNRWADLIRAAYHALGRGEIEPLVTLLDRDAEWHGVRGWRGRRDVCRGHEAIAAALRSLVEKGNPRDSDSWHVHDVIQSGELVAVTFTWHTPAGTTIPHAHLLLVGTDRIIQIQGYARAKRALATVENHGRPTGLVKPVERLRRL